MSEPWRNLIRKAAQTARTRDTVDHPNFGDPLTGAAADQARADLLRIARQDLQIGSWYALLDLADWLSDHLPIVWKSLTGQTPDRAPTTGETAVINALQSYTLPAGLPTALLVGVPARPGDPRHACRRPGRRDRGRRTREAGDGRRPRYDRTQAAPGWPGFLFPLSDPTVFPTPLPRPRRTPTTRRPPRRSPRRWCAPSTRRCPRSRRRRCRSRAWPSSPSSPLGTPGSSSAASTSGPSADRSSRTVCSDPTEPFQMASFFDPDAPARPIRIALPIDTTPAGLRKFDKNTAFMVTDVLCGQIEAAQGPRSRRSRALGAAVAVPQGSGAAGAGPARTTAGYRGHDLLALDPDHHDLRADPADHHRHPARHHLPLDAVLHHLLPVPEFNAKEAS